MKKKCETGRTLDMDCKPSATGNTGSDAQTKGLSKQKPVVNGSESWRPSKIRRLLGELSMNKLLIRAGGDPKRLSEALSQLKTSNVDPKQQDQVYQTLNCLLGRGDEEAKGHETSEEEDEVNEGSVFWEADSDGEEEGRDLDQFEDDDVDSVLTGGEIMAELGEEDERERDRRKKESFEDFRKYVEYAKKNLLEFTDIERASVRLMHKLIKKKAPLDTYEHVMEWHLQESGVYLDMASRWASPLCSSAVRN